MQNFDRLLDPVTLPSLFSTWSAAGKAPWDILSGLSSFLTASFSRRAVSGYRLENGSVIHERARIEPRVVIKGPAFIGPDCFLATGVYVREGVYLGSRVTLGPGVEVKTSIIGDGTSVAHFNFVGDSILGRDVNLEAGAVIANYHNDRQEKEISLLIDGVWVKTGVSKFGAVVGDGSKIGANSVLSPGTVLQKNTIVPRLTLV